MNSIQTMVEQSALRAWPAFESVQLDRWVLRFANGYSKRANSVTVLDAADEDCCEKITHCEAFYAERGLPTIFRLPSFCHVDALDHSLLSRGYRRVEPSEVLQLPFGRVDPVRENIEILDMDDWLALYNRLQNHDAVADRDHRGILQRIDADKLFAARIVDGKAVACAMGVVDGALFGLFDIVTDPRHRRKGHARELIAGMLSRVRGSAELAYLQVVSSNLPAINLYRQLGFSELYRYWYRVQAAG